MAVLDIVVKVSGDTAQITKITNDVRQAETATNNLTKSTDKLNTSLVSLKSTIATLGIGLAAKEFIKTADAMTLLAARINLVKGESDKFANIQSQLLQIANENRTEIQAVTTLYVRLAPAMKELGVSTKTTLDITNAFSKALLVGGVSAQEAASATLQFAQAMASGRLQGDEFRSIAEASPTILQILAKNLNVTTGELRKMAEEGKLTSGVLGKALLQNLDDLSNKAKSIPATVGGAFQIFKNELAVTIDELNKSQGITEAVAGAFTDLTNALKNSKDELQTIAKVLSSVLGFALEHADNVALAAAAYFTLTKGIKAANTAMLIFNGTVRLNPLIMGATVIAAGIYAVSEALDAMSKSAKLATDTTQKNLYNFDAEKANQLKNQVTEINATIFNQEKALKGLSGQAKQALQTQINGLKAQRDELLKTANQLTSTSKKAGVDPNDLAKLSKTKPDDKALKEAERLEKQYLDRRTDLLTRFTEVQLTEVEKPYLKAATEYQKDLDRFAKVKGAKEELTRIYVETIDALNDESAKKQEQRETAALARLNELSGNVGAVWLDKEQAIRDKFVGTNEDTVEAIVKLEKKAYDQSAALDERRLKNASSTADGIEFFFNRAAYQVQTDAERIFSVMQTISSATENAFMEMYRGIIKGSLDVRSTISSLLNAVAEELFRIYVVKSLVTGITNAVRSVFARSPELAAPDYNASANLSAGYGFANGGYTGDGGKYQVKGVVHGGEYVIPKWQVEKMPSTIAALEGIRKRGYADGGMVSDTQGGGNVEVRIINQGGQEVKADKATSRFDMGKQIIEVFLSGLQNNTSGLQDSIRAVR